MPKLRSLSAKEILKILKTFNFEINSQKGSHVKLVRQLKFEKQIIIIPNHKVIDKGTIKAIYNQASRFISSKELQKHFYIR